MTEPDVFSGALSEAELFGSAGVQLLSQVLRQARVAVWAADDEAHNFAILYWNEGAEEVYGYTRDEVLGRNYVELFVSEGERDRAIDDHRRILRSPASDATWQRLANDVTAQGKTVSVVYSAFRLVSPSLGRPYLVEVNLDVSRSLMTAQTPSAPDDKAVVASGAELDDIEKQAVTDTYGVIVPLLVHRAGNAIDAILTEAVRLGASLPSSPDNDVRRRLSRIESRAIDLRSLLNEVCDLSMDEPPRSRVNVLELVQSTRLAWFRADLRNVEVSYEIDPDLCCATYDLLLREALSSIITNACEAVLRTPVMADGELAVAGDVVVRADTDAEAGQILLHVDDNGPGLQPEVFTAGRIRPTFKEHKHGHRHGHGLMYAERALDRIRGELRLSPEPSPLGGARVTVMLHNQAIDDGQA